MAEFTDEILRIAANELGKRRAADAGGCYSDFDTCDGEKGNCKCLDEAIVDARAALSAVAPMIRAQAFREAATIADEHRDDCAGKLSRGRRSWSDHDIAVFESAESEANSISVAILALAQKETAR